jgi:hypothetical protein
MSAGWFGFTSPSESAPKEVMQNDSTLQHRFSVFCQKRKRPHNAARTSKACHSHTKRFLALKQIAT